MRQIGSTKLDDEEFIVKGTEEGGTPDPTRTPVSRPVGRVTGSGKKQVEHIEPEEFVKDVKEAPRRSGDA
jgi:hypothetical protein